MKITTALLFFTIFVPCAVVAQPPITQQSIQDARAAQEEELRFQQYLQTAHALDMEVWNRNMPRFSDYSIPEEYAGESAVIIAADRDISISAKKGSRLMQIMGGHGGGNITYADVQRFMIRINDRSALDYYSDFDFKQRHESKMGFVSNKYTTFMGIRVIKPDGEMQYVDVYNHAVKVTEGKDDKEAYHRIAIPNLQIGDVIDYYYCGVYNLDVGDITDQAIRFYTLDYPALHVSARISIDGPATLEYRPINGAPDFERSVTDTGTTVLEVAVDNPIRLNLADNLRWISVDRTLPTIRFSVFQNKSRSGLVTPSARPAGIHKNVSPQSIIDDAAWYMGFDDANAIEKRDIKKDIATFKAANPWADNTALAQYIADRVALTWNYYGYVDRYNDRSFAIILHELLAENGIGCKVGFVSKRSLARADEVFDPSDLRCIVTANDDSQIFIYGNHLFHAPAETSALFAGETAVLYENPAIKKTLVSIKKQGLSGNKTSMTLPASPDSANADRTTLSVKFSDSDPALLEISRREIYTGEIKREIQPLILHRDVWDREMRKYLSAANASYTEELNQRRATRKYIDGVLARFDKEREEQADKMKQEIDNFHGIKPETLVGYTISSLGVTPLSPALEYTIDYTMYGFVRRAGDDIILDLGKLAGTQWSPTDSERKRLIDAWLPGARRYDTEVRIDIPEGYAAVDPAEPLDMRMENKYGSFTAEVTFDDGCIIVKTMKIYKADYIPVADFAVLLEMIDAANEFFGKSVVLTKK